MISPFLNNLTDVPANADSAVAVLDFMTNRSNWRFASASESSSKMIPSTPTTSLYSVTGGMLSHRRRLTIVEPTLGEREEPARAMCG